MPTFWDVDVKKLDPKQHKDFIIARILDRGTLSEVRKLLKKYEPDDIKQVIKTNKRLSPQTGSFWSAYYNIPDKKIACLQTPLNPIQKKFWPY